MRKKIIKDMINQTGYKCDREGCGYREAGVNYEYLDEYEADLKRHLSMKCPRCGDPLLTVEDYNVSIVLLRVIHHPLYRLVNWIGGLFSKRRRFRLDMNGTGNLSVTEVA
jgi:hypothetical protein